MGSVPKFAAFLAVTLGLLLGGPSADAHAAWHPAASGTGYAKARTMPSGNAPTATASNRSVTMSWTASSFSGGGAVGGYVVKRYDAGNQSQTVLSNCSGTIAGLTCTENAVPSGSWRYTVTPKHSNWLGTESAKSSAVSVSAPSLTLSPTTVTSLPSTLSGSIANFIPGQTVTFRLDNSLTGTVLSGSISTSPVPSSGGATASVTIPAATSNGAHTVYAIGSQGDVASQPITVAVPVCTPSQQTINPDADTTVQQDKPSNGATATTMDVKSDSSNNKLRRSLLHFTLPSIPTGCSLTSASLKLFTTSGVTGRSIAAYRASASWTESGVLWATQPATTGSPATAASVASGLVTWTVTTQTQAMYSGTNNGFSIRDANELTGAVLQTYSTRESATNKPQLVLNFG